MPGGFIFPGGGGSAVRRAIVAWGTPCDSTVSLQTSVCLNATVNRRRFLQGLSAGLLSASCLPGCAHRPRPEAGTGIKPIRGSWISIWWDDDRHYYWNEACLKWTATQWELAVRDMAELGFKYIVLLAVAKSGKAFYDTALLPKLEMACEDPIGALLRGADRHRMKVFMSSDWYAEWDERALLDPERVKKRFQMMEELASRYARHRSFYGWYWPNEACLTPYYTENFIRHVNECGAEARRLMPKARTLIAPYGTNKAVCDATYMRQLERVNVDIIAYQDEVGCFRMTPAQSAVAYRTLREAHNNVPQRALWADVEVFDWEGPPNRQTSRLIPARFDRLHAQLEAVSPFVDEVLIYQYQGLMNKPGSEAFAGHSESATLYANYVQWLRRRG